MPQNQGYNTGGSSGGVDHMIGPSPGSMRLLNQLATQPSRNLPSAIAKIGAAFIESYAKQKKAEAQRAQREARATKRGGWADALGAGETLRGLAASDPTILGDQDFIKFWTSTKPKKGFEDILDDQGSPIGQRGPDGRVVAHPLAPKPPGPAETKKDAQGFLRFFGGDQHGQRVYPDVVVPEDEPELSPPVLAFEQLLERGHLDAGTTYPDYKSMGRASTTFNMPAPTPERGYENVYDPQGNLLSQQVIPGSKAARAIEAEEEKASLKAQSGVQRANIVSEHASGIRRLMDEATLPTTGLFSGLQNIPGSSAHDIARRVDTLKALVGFQQLNQMRSQSPTGGALGNVTEKELGFLQSVIGSLEMSQSEDQFRENLQRVEDSFSQIIHGTQGGQPAQGQADGAGRSAQYSGLTADQLKRQVAIMKANPGDYAEAELRAAALAWQSMYPGQ